MEGRLHGLDSLRGIAALTVLVWHLQLAFGQMRVLTPGYLAVDFFFMLSGYVLARTYERKLGPDFTASSFMRTRLRRLWPTTVAGGLIGAGLLFYFSNEPHVTAAVVVANLLFIPTPEREPFPVNGPTWSIHIELAANLAHALVLRKLSVRALLVVSGTAGLAEAMMALQVGTIGLGPTTEYFPFAYLRVVPPYCLGIVFYRIWRDRPPIAVPRLITFAAFPLLLLVKAEWWIDLLFVFLACPLLIAGALGMSPRSGPVLGAISFPLYVVHSPTIWVVKAFGGGIVLAGAAALFVALMVLAAPKAWSIAEGRRWIQPRRGWRRSPS